MSQIVDKRDEGGSKSEKEVHLFRIAAKMKDAGLTADFVSRIVRSSLQYEGMADLMVFWDEATTESERDEIVATMDDESVELDPRDDPPVRKPKINYNELESVAEQVMAFKEGLRKKVDKWGGLTKLARETGIPQPSLSRFFKTAAMPRRTTLYKIATAMDLSETEISTPWAR